MERRLRRPQGTGEWRVPGSLAANYHCLVVIGFEVEYGVELPLPAILEQVI